MDDLNTVAQVLTEGLRSLPTDDITRVKHFLTEYLGNARHPVPFGGRARDFERLDTWLNEREAPSYALLAAPAGRGKSALLLRWCQRLLTRPELAVVYFPVSIRFRTNLAGVVFPALVALLARLHAEKLPADSYTHEDVWRGLLLEYMTRPLPDGRQLVLVLDGVDEAADWEAGPWLFPAHPPANLRVILSARYLANDQGTGAWLERLGWTAQDQARTFELYPLDRSGIASVLIQMGFPLDLLGTRVDIVSELHRLSAGDPLLIRLYVDDLWERGDAALRLAPEDLHTIRPGLVGYFERWWNDQRLLWSQEAPPREAAIQTVLNLLAGALGPLSKADILNLAPDDPNLRQGDIEQHLEPLARFVIGDGMRQGYVFSHPRLASYFLEERLSASERQAVERRFLAWGERTLAALNAGSLPPEQASPYIVQYYGAHLERAQAGAEALLALVSNGWRRAWEKLDRANAGFLGDSERAWRVAERADAAASAAGEIAPYLGAELRSLLCRVSINSMTSNISPRLMLEAVKTGVWTPAQGLASLRLISDAPSRARELVGLASYLPEPLRTDVLQEALDTLAAIKQERDRLDILVELAPAFSQELLGQIMETVPSIDDEADRAGLLTDLAPALAAYPALIEKAVDFAQEIEEEEYLALALAGLAAYLPAEQHAHVLQLARAIEDERYRAQALMALSAHLPASLLGEIVGEARQLRAGILQVRLLAELACSLPEHAQAEALQETLDLLGEIVDQEYRVELLLKLVPCLPAERLPQVLREVQALWDENYRAHALSELLPYILLEEQLPVFLRAVLDIKNEEQRAVLIFSLLPRLSEEHQAMVLDCVQGTWDEGLRVEILAKLAPIISENLLDRVDGLIQQVKDPGYAVWLVAELQSSLGERVEGVDSARIFRAIPDEQARLQTLLAIAPRLSDEAYARIFALMEHEIFGFPATIRAEDYQAEIFSKLASRLPEKWLSTALAQIHTWANEVYQAQALIALAPRIHEDLLAPALDIARTIRERTRRAQVLEALVSALPAERKGGRVREMLQVLQIIKDEKECSNLFCECVRTLAHPFPADRLPLVLDIAGTMHLGVHRVRVLIALIPHLPASAFEDVLTALRSMRSEERALILDALVPHLPERLVPLFLAAVQALPGEGWRARVLASMATTAPALFEGVLALTLDLQDEKEQARILAALAQHAPESAFPRLWSAIEQMKDDGKRSLVLGALAPSVPTAFFPRFWRTVWRISGEGRQLWVVTALASHVPERLFPQFWASLQGIPNKNWRETALRALAPRVPESYFPEVFPVALALATDPSRSGEEKQAEKPGVENPGNALAVLAAHVPERYFMRFWQAVNQVEDHWRQIWLREILAEHVPEDCFTQIWRDVSQVEDVWRRGRLWEKMVPRIPEDCFAQVWNTLSIAEDAWLREKLLVLLAPCVPDAFFAQCWNAVKAIDNVMRRAQAIHALIPRFPQEKLAEALDAALAISYRGGRVEVLEALIPRLSTEQCAALLQTQLPSSSDVSQWSEDTLIEALDTMMQRQREWWKRIILPLVPRLPAERVRVVLPAFLKVTARWKKAEFSADEYAQIVTSLATNVPAEQAEIILDAIWSIETEEASEQALLAYLATLAPSAWARVFDLATAKTHAAGDVRYLLGVLVAAGSLSEQPALLYPALREILHMLEQRPRPQALSDLTKLAPVVRALGGEEAITAICCSILEIGSWWP